ncbi:hypothetical protein H0H92_003177 [Tricholoma furcatifolium]|nr:hypothetical protein H0H92_003177 [Tricholoma furcatifolium]
MSSKDNEVRLPLNKKGTSYAVLTLLSDSGFLRSSISDTPAAVTGSVNLVLADERAIHAVVVTVKGQIGTRSTVAKYFTFLDISQTLWSGKTEKTGHRKKLFGSYQWPFTITLPQEVLIPAGQKFETFRLPESFSERHVRDSIMYTLSLRLIQGRFRLDDRLQVALSYPPVTWSNFFQLRESLRGTAFWLRGPNEDPEAWYTHRGGVTGSLNYQHLIDAKYTLSLAKPLWYSRGSVIPCSLQIEANDENALEALSSPTAPVLRLRRRIKCCRGSSSQDVDDYSELATWWSFAETNIANVKQLSGELQIPFDMKPTTAIAHFSIEYSAILFPFDAATFSSISDEPLAAVHVRIA